MTPVSIGVFCSEHRPDLKDPLKTTACGRHLLVELRRLRQTGRLVEVLQGEHIGPSLRSTAAESVAQKHLQEFERKGTNPISFGV